MYNKIYINESDTNIKAGDIKFILDKKCEYWRVYFSMSRIKWALFENNYYDKDIEKFNNKDENNKYTSLQSIPKYYVYKDNVKLGPVLPRKTIENKPFLFIPQTYKKGGKLLITKDYYIYDVDEEYNINEKAILIFYQ